MSKKFVQKICAFNVDEIDGRSEKESSPSEAILTMVYTNEEECWLQKQIDLLEMAFRSVPMGEEIMEEFAMYSLGVKFHQHFMNTFFVKKCYA